MARCLNRKIIESRVRKVNRAIGYLRVSTPGQVGSERFGDEKFGLDAQRQMIETYAAENGYEIIKWISDEGISGVKDNRPGFDQILYNESPDYDAVLVAKSDRVARDIKLYFYYLYALEKKRVKLISVQEKFDDDDGLSGIYRSLLIFVAEQERKNIMARTSAGRAVKAGKGGYSGGNVPYGYKVENHGLVPNPEETQIVKIVFDCEKMGVTLTQTADYLNSQGYKSRCGRNFQSSHIRSILSNREVYEGFYKYGKMDYVKGDHRPLLAV